MAFIDTFYRLQRLAELIKRKSTGTRKDLAQRLEVSERTVDNLIAQLRFLCEDERCEIYFCSMRNSYCFSLEVDVRFEMIVPVDNSRSITGGRNFLVENFEVARFLRRAG